MLSHLPVHFRYQYGAC